ncbi:hypothetical protein SAMN02745883_02182 [Caminicella sporogenes DSM 14501]|uniref:Uncharacterized protein n=1 Tax=Caminicella sporogenes DSM 14501 TaxID=1121266 RepID=A0A1M6SXI2_9FIRM|nr:hypothetical protein [Caminicella sporogenes]SHK49396.1 hypothetical protein SAMN02745883_02182 [Caminicella sporogenes DSM 14501]
MFFKHKDMEDMEQIVVNELYYNLSQNKDFNIKYYLHKTETKIFNMYLVISAINIFVYAYILSLKIANDSLNLIIVIGASIFTFFYFLRMNIKAYNILKEILKPVNVDDCNKIPSWIINLYGLSSVRDKCKHKITSQ